MLLLNFDNGQWLAGKRQLIDLCMSEFICGAVYQK